MKNATCGHFFTTCYKGSEVIGENEVTRLEKMEYKLCAYNMFLGRRLKEFLQYGSKKDHN